jgi:hypothetical protein
MTKAHEAYEREVLDAHRRYSAAIAALDEHDAVRGKIIEARDAAEAELKVLARMAPR